MQFEMNGSLFLIGAALALAGIVGVVQPPGHRSGVLLALLAGIGVGIAGLALRLTVLETGRDEVFWRTFFACSIAGFVTVVAMLAVAWRRARPRSETVR
jgi:drug/metabolite transporter (DMT)-like permease